MDGRARGRVIQRPQPIAAAAVEQPDELGPAAACPSGLDACELALDLAGEEHLAAQEARRRGASDASLAGTLDAILLLEPHQGRRELGGIVPVCVRWIDDVLLDDHDRQLLESPNVNLDRLRAATPRADARGGCD